MPRSSLIALAAAVALVGCASDDLVTGEGYNPETDTPTGKPATDGGLVKGSLFGGQGILGTSLGEGDGEKSGATLPVNRYIWRGALETLAFLPLSSTDPYGGVIITDWGSTDNAPNERFKVTAFITSAEFKPQALRVVVNRQIRDENGAWTAATVSPDTARQLEDAILTRARQIRGAEKRGKG